jgi:hypothetical protein
MLTVHQAGVDSVLICYSQKLNDRSVLLEGEYGAASQEI